MFHEINNIKITGGVLVVFLVVKQFSSIYFSPKSGVKRWCKMGGGVRQFFNYFQENI